MEVENGWNWNVKRSKSALTRKVEISVQKLAPVEWRQRTLSAAKESTKKKSRAREGLSCYTLQQQRMLSVSGAPVTCQSPKGWDQENLRTLLASKTLYVHLVWISPSPLFSLLERCLRTRSILGTASRGACRC